MSEQLSEEMRQIYAEYAAPHPLKPHLLAAQGEPFKGDARFDRGRLEEIRERYEAGLGAAYQIGHKRGDSSLTDDQLAVYACASDVEPLLRTLEQVADMAQGWVDEYSDPLYLDNAFCRSVVTAGQAVLATIQEYLVADDA